MSTHSVIKNNSHDFITVDIGVDNVFIGKFRPLIKLRSLPDPTVFSFRVGSTSTPTTSYQWKIVAHGDHCNTTEGAVWTFTTYGND